MDKHETLHSLNPAHNQERIDSLKTYGPYRLPPFLPTTRYDKSWREREHKSMFHFSSEIETPLGPFKITLIWFNYLLKGDQGVFIPGNPGETERLNQILNQLPTFGHSRSFHQRLYELQAWFKDLANGAVARHIPEDIRQRAGYEIRFNTIVTFPQLNEAFSSEKSGKYHWVYGVSDEFGRFTHLITKWSKIGDEKKEPLILLLPRKLFFHPASEITVTFKPREELLSKNVP